MSDSYYSPLLKMPGVVEGRGDLEGVALHFGNPVKEQRALEDGHGFADLSLRVVYTTENGQHDTRRRYAYGCVESGEPAIVETENINAEWEKFCARGYVCAGIEAWRAVRVSKGIPDAVEDTCLKIAPEDYVLTKFWLEGVPAQELPEPGSPIFVVKKIGDDAGGRLGGGAGRDADANLGANVCGYVTTVARHWEEGPVALGFLRKDVREQFMTGAGLAPASTHVLESDACKSHNSAPQLTVGSFTCAPDLFSC
ncbi:hypothetical protein [Actinotignum urinale]|uniref:hypothetical protein n=1 Tax=Actinotignum urinale TaxID=190146 RepID=UPI0003B66842|nr:hypothetical protein [Actinotignum urinale]MDY5160391.1 hypothetical protein [Actinotignum urinale]